MASIDHFFFLLINKTLAVPPLDSFMVTMTRSHTLINIFAAALSLYLIATVVLRREEGHWHWGFYPKRALPAIVLIISALVVYGVSDAIPHRVFKPLIGRLRPCNPTYFVDGVHRFLIDGRFLLGQKSSLSMPSIHALSAFTQALFWGTYYPKARWWLIPFATFIAYSRVYVGVHYPADILVGALLGSLLGYYWARLTQQIPLAQRLPKPPRQKGE